MPDTVETTLELAEPRRHVRWTILDGLRATPRGERLALAGWVGTCAIGGAVIGGLTGGAASPWYAALAKPGWTPPSWVFAPVWTTLYVLMGVAAWRIWRIGHGPKPEAALDLFVAQLACNFAWSPLFFSWRRPDYALVDLVVLWSLVLLTIAEFTRLDRPAARLLWPYLAWVTYAAALNVAIVGMN